MSPRNQAAVAAAGRARASQLEPVHAVPYDEPGRKRARARCGLMVDRHAQRGAITCRTCLDEIAHFEGLDFGQHEEDFAVTHPLFSDLPDDEPETEDASASADVVDETPQTLAPSTIATLTVSNGRAPVLTFPAPGPVERATNDGSIGTGPEHDAAPSAPGDSTAIAFPLLSAGELRLSFDKLAEPARQVAELIERLEPVLAPPAVVANLERLVLQANAVNVVDAASYQRAVALYEELAANEKGIEGDGTGDDVSIGAVVAFFHRPWKAMCAFRARFAKPVADAKKRLSDTAGAWKLADDRRVADEQRAAEQLLQLQERDRLQALAAEAKKQDKPELAAAAETAALTVARPVLPVAAFSPTLAATGTGTRKKAEAVVSNEDAFYKGLADGTISRMAAPIDQGWLNRQANDFPKDEFEKRYPGVTWQQKGGLTARGNR